MLFCSWRGQEGSQNQRGVVNTKYEILDADSPDKACYVEDYKYGSQKRKNGM